MYYQALAVDYDGTLATDGVVDASTLEALTRLKQSGRRLILVTGRIIEQLVNVFPQLKMCDLVVSDNGALVYDPHTGVKQPLIAAPPREFIEELARRGVPQLEIGDVIVATWEPHESTVLDTIRDLGLELQIIFNKGAVMILPTGVNKATGLTAALKQLGLASENTVGIGDAENDEAFLKLCGASAAVANALDVVKKQASMVMQGARGAGVTELIDQLLADDLEAFRIQRAHSVGCRSAVDVHGENNELILRALACIAKFDWVRVRTRARRCRGISRLFSWGCGRSSDTALTRPRCR